MNSTCPSATLPARLFKRLRPTLAAGLAFTSVSALHASQPAGSNTFATAPAITVCNDPSFGVNLMTCNTETGEPGHNISGSQAGQKSAWWKWTAPESGFCTVDTQRTVMLDTPMRDTVVAVYTGDAVDALTRVVANDDSRFGVNIPGGNLSSVTFLAVKGTTYHFAVDGYAAGNIDATHNQVALRVRHLPALKRIRTGVFCASSDPGMQGSLTVNQSATHAFSAKLVLGSKVTPFNGVLGADGYFGIAFERKAPAGSPPLTPVTLWIDGTSEGTFRIHFGPYLFFAGNLYDNAVFTAQNINSTTGACTVSVSSMDLEGVGGIAATIKSTGAVTGAGFMPDGTAVTFSSALCPLPEGGFAIPFYQSLAASKGFVMDIWKLAEGGALDTLTSLKGGTYYRAPNAKSAFYPDGIYTSFDVEGQTYVKPAAGHRALDFLDASMGMGKFVMPASMGETAVNVMLPLTLTAANKFTFTPAPANKPALTLNTATGLLTGSVTVPPGKPRALRGVLFSAMGMTYLQGTAAGTTKNIRFDVTP